MEKSKFEELIEDAGIDSFAELGRKVRSTWAAREETEDLPTADTLKSYVSNLANGDTVWWENHPVPFGILCEILGVTEARIMGHQARRPGRVFFAAFPEVRPFEPGQESLPPGFTFAARGSGGFRSLESLLEDWEGEQATWLQAPGGTEAELLAAVVAEWIEAEVLTSATLEESLDSIEATCPTVVLVEQAQSGVDAEVAAKLRDGPLLVVAPFDCPGNVSTEAGLGPPMRVGRRRRADGTDDGWQALAWEPSEGWRSSFLEWIEHRLTVNTPFTAEGLIPWLEEKDPLHTIFGTPSSLLALSAYVDRQERGERGLRESDVEDVGNWWLTRSAPDTEVSEVRREWLRRFGTKTMKHLVSARLEQLSIGLGSGLTRDGWTAMIPEALCTGRHSDASRESLEKRIIEAEEQASATRIIAECERLDSSDVFDHLAGAGLLRERLTGLFWLEPDWLRGWLERRIVTEKFSTQPNEWGALCLDSERRARIDECLDQMEAGSLIELVDRVVETFSLQSVEVIAAVEALFAACGRRLIDEPEAMLEHSRPLVRLLECQLRVLELDCLPRVGPMTRPALNRWGRFDAVWKLGCWAWSLAVDEPEEFAGLRSDVANLFPGWYQPTIGDELELRFNWDGIEAPAGDHGQLVDRVVRGVWETYERPEFDDWLPEPFIPLILIDVASGRLDVPADEKFLPGEVFASRVVELAADLNAEQQQRLSDFVLACFEQKTRRSTLDAFVNQEGELARWCIDRLSPDRFEQMLERRGLGGTVIDLSLVPVNLRSTLYDYAVDHPGELWLEEFFRSLEPDQRDVPGLVRLVEALGHRVRPAARAVWRLAPDCAIEETEQTLRGDYSVWLGCAPPSQRRRLLELIAAQREQPPPSDWVKAWVRRQIPDGGPDARLAFDVYRDVWSGDDAESNDG